MIRRPPRSTLFPYTRSSDLTPDRDRGSESTQPGDPQPLPQRFPQAIRPRSLPPPHRICNQQYLYRLRHRQGGGESSRIANAASRDRKSTRLNSSHGYISYAVFCLKKKNNRVLALTDVTKAQPTV